MSPRWQRGYSMSIQPENHLRSFDFAEKFFYKVEAQLWYPHESSGLTFCKKNLTNVKFRIHYDIKLLTWDLDIGGGKKMENPLKFGLKL